MVTIGDSAEPKRQFRPGTGQSEKVEEIAMTDADHSPDAELLRLAVDLACRVSVEKQIANLDVTEETDAAFKVEREKSSALIGRITRLPAATLAGLRVKAQAIAWFDSSGRGGQRPALRRSGEPSRLPRRRWRAFHHGECCARFD
jgi:hypothetical protein